MEPRRSNRLQQFLRDEGATASLELVIVFPLLMIVFIAAFESSMILTRQIMLERTLDMSVRVLRLAQGVTSNADEVRTTICSNTQLLPGCAELLTLDLQIIDRDTYNVPGDDDICADRNHDIPIRPENEFQQGADNDFLMIRTCLIVDRILPFSGLGLNLARDDTGGLHMMATTVFVNEPG